MYKFFLGLDLGQAQDYTALAVVERKVFRYEAKPDEYHIRHLERPKLGTPYPAIVERVQNLMQSNQLINRTALVVDKTGVGAPVVDMFRKAGLRPVAITITGGNSASSGDGGYHVPKRDLVTTLQVLFQTGRLKVAAELADARLLVEELLNFKVKINVKTAHDSYEAWREGVHDDLVLAAALACWYGEKCQRMTPVPKPAGW
ncbi:MAG: hypothetical protein H5U02_01820 [Clostridia bacterium]|nr:hypothetical protein [Clostridia bacterium]